MTRAEDRPATRIENLRDQIVGSFDSDLAAHGRKHLDELVADAEALAEALERAVPYLFNSPLEGSLDRYDEAQAALARYRGEKP